MQAFYKVKREVTNLMHNEKSIESYKVTHMINEKALLYNKKSLFHNIMVSQFYLPSDITNKKIEKEVTA